ncbi:MAG: hypothetical protein JW983_09105 [Elusimicrobia bacterium]|nr:hypothetical protein [Elusimicrobiota bacterium]
MRYTNLIYETIDRFSKRMIKFILLLLVLLLPTPYTLYPAFKDSGWGARPAGMGGAYTAVSDDSNGMLYNPAGICQLKNVEVNFMHAELYTGLREVDLGLKYAAIVCPAGKVGTFGANWANFVSADQYKEDTLSLTYAAPLTKQDATPKVFCGINVKQLRHAYVLDQRTETDPVFAEGDSKSAITADFGLWLEAFSDDPHRISLGVVVKNMTQPDVGLKTEDIVPSELRLGIAYKVIRWGKVKNFLTSIDGVYRKQEWGTTSDKVNLHIGSEAWFFDEFLGFRIGSNYTELTSGVSFKISIWDKFRTQLDYAFMWPLQIQESMGSHRISLSCRFGPLVKR